MYVEKDKQLYFTLPDQTDAKAKDVKNKVTLGNTSVVYAPMDILLIWFLSFTCLYLIIPATGYETCNYVISK